MNGGEDRWQDADLVGGWFVMLLPSARAKALRKHLPDFLRGLKRAGTDAPFAAADVLLLDAAPLPTIPIRRPSPVSHTFGL